MRLRVATYNIHGCVGRDGVSSPSRIAEVLGRMNPDVAALQEVFFDADSPGNVLKLLARSINAEAIPGPTLLKAGSRYGNAALSRIPPADVRRVDLSLPDREPRGALGMTLRLEGRMVRIVATHLGLRPRERRWQMRRVLGLLDGVEDAVTILLGDFNEWLQWGRPLRWAARRFGSLPAPATFPSNHPVLALDRIWVHPPERLVFVRPYAAGPAKIASDHLPLIAEIEV